MKINSLIITNLPAFYKIRLYNQIANHKKIFVIYTGNTANERNQDFFDEKPFYNYILLQGTIITKILTALSILQKIDYEELIIGGWDQLICWLFAILSPRGKNSCIVESSIFESRVKGIKSIIKVFFLSRISKAYVCGIPHNELVKKLGFKGKIIETGGCGILNYVAQPSYMLKQDIRNFLYVGRLVPVKGLDILIEVFNRHPQLTLNIIGFGPLEQVLKKKAKSNIIFWGAINNKNLMHYYRLNDVFILPSISEPWGLVVEEALNNGLPVIVSDKVGCSIDLVRNKNTGLIFVSEDVNDLERAILQMLDIKFYNSLRYNVAQMNFDERANKQIQSYL